MSRYTTAYSAYLSQMKEVELLRAAAAKLERRDAIANSDHINALCRAAVVLLSSHLEAYIKELGEILLNRLVSGNVDRAKINQRFFYHLSKTHIDNIKETSGPDASAHAIFSFLETDVNLWSQSGVFGDPLDSESFNKGFASPSVPKICKYFRRFGFDNYKNELRRNLTRDELACSNMVNHLVTTRNNIAHGDPLATKTPSEVFEMMGLVKKFCTATDTIFATWCKEQYCVIR